MGEVLAGATLLKVNRSEAQLLTGETDPARGSRAAGRHGRGAGRRHARARRRAAARRRLGRRAGRAAPTRSTRPAPATSSPACWSPRSRRTATRPQAAARGAARRGRGGGPRNRGLGRDRRAPGRDRGGVKAKTTWKPPRAQPHPRHPRPAARLLRPAAQRAAPRAARRAGADGALAEHERPQPRRRLRAAARALPRLGRRVAAAPVEEIEEAIRPGGISKVKSLRIKSMLGVIEAETGGLDLGFLADAPRDEAIEFLERLPGVGRKTAACVLLFAFDRPEMPVDTHVYRVCARLGLIRPKASFEEAHDVMRARDRPGRRLRAPRQPDPPRPPDLQRAQARLPRSARCWASAPTASARPGARGERATPPSCACACSPGRRRTRSRASATACCSCGSPRRRRTGRPTTPCAS